MANHKNHSRTHEILRILIEHYIREGQPIASKTIAEHSKLSLSSASIRSIMADLEDAGLIVSPHTSAGRIPTTKGYRFFVNKLLQTQVQPEIDVTEFYESVDDISNSKDLASSVSSLISDITHLAGIVTIPKREQHILRHIEFLPLSNNRVLVILVLDEHEVQNRVIHTDRTYTEQELNEAANFVLARFVGKQLPHVRAELIAAMDQERQSMESWMADAMSITQEALHQDPKEDYVLRGEANLLGTNDDLTKMRALFDAFARKRSILHLLDQCMSADGLQIFIGQESGVEVFGDYSVVTAPYTDGELMGVLGVIGPTRMDYSRAIAAVDVTAKLISAALKEDGA